MPDAFIRYVGPSDLHDGRIVQVISNQGTTNVMVKSYEGRQFDLIFSGVTDYQATAPEGMTLYALAEMQHAPPQRKFVFANWDDDDASELTIVATDLHIADTA